MFLGGLAVAKGQFKGEQFDFGFWDIVGEPCARTIDVHAHLGAQVGLGHVIEPVDNAVFLPSEISRKEYLRLPQSFQLFR